MNMPSAQGGGSKKVATRSGKHSPPRGFEGVNIRSGIWRGVRKTGNADLLRCESEGVLCKAEDN